MSNKIFDLDTNGNVEDVGMTFGDLMGLMKTSKNKSKNKSKNMPDPICLCDTCFHFNACMEIDVDGRMEYLGIHNCDHYICDGDVVIKSKGGGDEKETY